MKLHHSLSKSIGKVIAITLLFLLVPFIASHLTAEVAWSLVDFTVAGVLIFATGIGWIHISRTSDKLMYRAGAGLALATTLFLIWANLAVGIIGSVNNAINLIYFLIVLIVAFGLSISRLDPKGMAVTFLTAALAQALTVPIAIVTGMHELEGSSVLEIFGVNLLFVSLYSLSAALIYKSLSSSSKTARLQSNSY